MKNGIFTFAYKNYQLSQINYVCDQYYKKYRKDKFIKFSPYRS